ncbi:MAG: rod shape-determining protein RodA [Bacteroidales bacterium]|nr:rod shape-determining protein RodA [Bacteroidales bacterium]
MRERTTDRKRFDWVLIALYAGLVLFGWLNIYAALYDESHAALFDMTRKHGKQLMWIGISFVVALLLLMTEAKVFSSAAYVIYGFTTLLLVVTLFIGKTTNGGQSWIDFGSVKLQPSEFAKLGTALALAKYMSTIDLDLRKWRARLTVAAIVLVPALLVLLQHDTGSALVFASFILPLYREGLSGKVLLVGVAAVALFVLALVINKYLLIGILLLLCLGYLFLWLGSHSRTRRRVLGVVVFFAVASAFTLSVDFAFEHILESHQKERIYVLLGKSDDLKGSGYNVHQSKIAIGSGGFGGKGFLKGTITKADFVPEQETDFIFCTVGEEWGFWGCTLLIAAYIVLLLRIITLAERQRSVFGRFYGYSTASILFIHLFINVGMVLGLLPVIGIPLPFLSYGGSSLLAFTFLLFIFVRQDAERNHIL